MANTSDKFRLQVCGTGTISEISKEGAMTSDTIKGMFEFFAGKDITEPIPLIYDNCRDETSRIIFDLMELEALQSKYALVEPLRAIKDPQTLFEICNVANYLWTPGLLDMV